MLEHGSNNSLPAKYRIALALSTAFLIHTLLLSGFPSILPDPTIRHRQQMNLELVATVSTYRAPASTDTQSANKTPEVRNPPFEVSPSNSPAPATPKLVTTRSEHEPDASDNKKATTSNRKPAITQAATPPTTSSTPSRPGARTQISETETTEPVSRISLSPAEQDPYLIKLAAHLATKLETLRIPAVRQLTETSSMELELQLLRNGALTRARVIRPTGIEPIDLAAYQAALAASPYPEPPPDQENKSRFEVKLVFSPSRL